MGTPTDLQDERVTSAVLDALQHRANSVSETEGQFGSAIVAGKLGERRRKRARRFASASTVVMFAAGAIGLSRIELRSDKNFAVPEVSVQSLGMPSLRLVPGSGTDDYELTNMMFDHDLNVGFGSFWGDASRQVTVRTFVNSTDENDSALVLPESVEAMIGAGPNGGQLLSSKVQVTRSWRSESTKFDVTVTFPPSTSWNDQVAVARSIRIGTSGEITTTSRPFGLPLVFSGSWSQLAPVEQWSIGHRKDFWVSAELPSKATEKLDRLGFIGFATASETVLIRGLPGTLFRDGTFFVLSWVEKGWRVSVSPSGNAQDQPKTIAELMKFAENLRPATDKEWSILATPNSALLRVSSEMQKPTRVVSQVDFDETQWNLQIGEGVTDAKCVNISVTSSASGEVLKDCVAVAGGPVLFSAIVTTGKQRVLVSLFNGTVDSVKIRGSRNPNESIVTEGVVIANNPEWTYVGALLVPLVGNDDVVIEALRVLPSEGIDVDAPDIDAPQLTDDEIAALDNELLEPAPTESLGSFPVK